MISFERSEKEIKEKKEPTSHVSPTRPTATAKPFSIPQSEFRINSNVQKGKLSFVRTSVRVLCLLIVRYTSPVPQIFSKLHKRLRVGGLFGV